MHNYQPALRYPANLSMAMVSYHSLFVSIQLLSVHQEFYLACLLFHTPWNVVIVIIKCKYLVWLLLINTASIKG